MTSYFVEIALIANHCGCQILQEQRFLSKHALDAKYQSGFYFRKLFSLYCFFFFTQMSSVFTLKQKCILYVFLFHYNMNCFHAENSHFSIQFLTYEEGFIAFLNISVRHAKKCETSDTGWLVFSRNRFCLVYPGTL